MPRTTTFSAASTLAITLSTATAAAGVTTTINADTGLKSWTLHDGALELQLVQRLPDQTRAFFLARGFPNSAANEIARSCVLQTIGRNTAGAGDPVVIIIDLKQWRVRHNGQTQPVKLKEAWAKEWRTNDAIPASAQLAFRWATFPTLQTYEPAQDYNWGMISFGPQPGETMDIKVVWQENGREKSALINAVTCPRDR